MRRLLILVLCAGGLMLAGCESESGDTASSTATDGTTASDGSDGTTAGDETDGTESTDGTDGGDGTDAAVPQPQDLVPPPEGQGFQMGIDTFAPAGTEIWKCYALDLEAPVKVQTTWKDPGTQTEQPQTFETNLAALLQGETALLLKGSAIIAYAEALKTLRTLDDTSAVALIAETRADVQTAFDALTYDADLAEILALLDRPRRRSRRYGPRFTQDGFSLRPSAGAGLERSRGSEHLACP